MGYYYHSIGDPGWQTMVFTTLTLSQLALVLSIRSERESFFTIGPLTNVPLLFIVFVTFLLQMMVTYTPFWQDLLKTRALSGRELLVSLAVAVLPFLADELRKVWVRRRR